jgi:RimJ/RimL family protein N-acetyltransferase
MPLTLHETTEQELDAVLALEADPDVAPWIGRWTRERQLEAICDPDEAHLVFADGRALAGFVLLAGLSRQDRSIELRRIALVRRGAGLGMQALELALRYGFDDRGAERVWLDVLERNARAQRLYVRAGFVYDDVPPEPHLLSDGSTALAVFMSTRRADWRSRRDR